MVSIYTYHSMFSRVSQPNSWFPLAEFGFIRDNRVAKRELSSAVG